MTGLITFIIVDSLLDREHDVSWQGFKQWWKHKLDRRHDEKLIKKTIKQKPRDETQLDEKIEREIDVEIAKTEEVATPGVWRKRAAYLLGAAVLFIFMPYFLEFLSVVTGVAAFTEIYGPLVFWNELSAPAFLLGFISICIFTAVIMYLVLKSFEVQEGAW